jgi:hypothetical protein
MDGVGLELARPAASLLGAWKTERAEASSGPKELEEQSPDLGPTHPDTLATGSLRGAILWDLGSYDESECELRSVGCAQEEALGPVHDSTLATCHRLTTTLIALGRLGEAEEVLGTVIEDRRQSLGDEHPDTRAAIADLEALCERRKTDPAADPERSDPLGSNLLRAAVRARDHGFGTFEKSAVPVIAFHWPVSGVVATAPLASLG